MILLAVSSGAGWYFFYVYRGNFGTVIPGQIYRSGQLGSEQLEQVIKEFGIRSIINLRGVKGDEDWYIQEKETAEKFGVELYNVAEMGMELQSYRLPARDEVEKLIALIASVPRPILAHCKTGADRTGLFSAVTLLLGQNGDLEQAWDHSSLKYLAIEDSAGSQFLQKYQDWLSGRKHTQKLFTQWLEQTYLPHYYKVRIQAIESPEMLEIGKSAVFRALVTNESPEIIPLRSSRYEGVQLRGHFYKIEGQKLSQYKVLEGKSVHFDLKPGDSAELELKIPAGLNSGRYILTFDLIDRYAWFNAKGSATETVEFLVKG